MSRLFLYIIFVIPLLFSCQEKYNKPPYDEIEEKLRKYPDTLKMLMIDSLWQKRDSLTYLRFKNVEQIYLAETDSIPNWITKFKSLEVLNTSNYQKKIRTIPSKIGSLKNIKQLYLPRNDIKTLPSSFYNLINIERLTLYNNNINELSKNMSEFKNLEVLYLDNNKISNLPTNICNLKKLKLISLKNTSIKILPPCIKNLYLLENLYINSTNISYLPLELLELPNLKEINAKGLKLTNYQEVKAICEKRNITFYYDEK